MVQFIASTTGVTPTTPISPGHTKELVTTAYVQAQNYAPNSTILDTASATVISGTKSFGVNPVIPTGARPGYALTAIDSMGSAMWKSPASARMMCQGRLTGVSGDPIGGNVGNTTFTGGSNYLYFTPYKGNLIGLYNGTLWDVIPFKETTILLAQMPVGAPASLPTQVYDVFAYNNNGLLCLEQVPWISNGYQTTGNGTRLIELAQQDGIYVKAGDPTRRYIGSFGNQDGMILDNRRIRYLWNYYNRIQKYIFYCDGTSGTTTFISYAPNSSYWNTWHPMGNNIQNSIFVVTGVSESPIYLKATESMYLHESNTGLYTGISLDYVNSGNTGWMAFDGGKNRTYNEIGQLSLTVEWCLYQPPTGLHSYTAIENIMAVNGSSTSAYYVNDLGSMLSGISGYCWC